jgi:hypothetical protein
VARAGVTTRTLAETGLTASTAFSVAPEKVTAAVLRAIAKPKAEMVVSVGPGRFLKALMDYFPGPSPAINRLSGATKLMAAVADYREGTANHASATGTATTWALRFVTGRRKAPPGACSKPE